MDKDHSRILTGNLRFLKNSNSLKRFSKGPQYRENRISDYLIASKGRYPLQKQLK